MRTQSLRLENEISNRPSLLLLLLLRSLVSYCIKQPDIDEDRRWQLTTSDAIR
jgi:hypothetical protein